LFSHHQYIIILSKLFVNMTTRTYTLARNAMMETKRARARARERAMQMEEEAVGVQRATGMGEEAAKPQQVEVREQEQSMEVVERQTVIRHICFACDRGFPEGDFDDDEWHRSTDRRCKACRRDGAGLAKRFDPNPVKSFIEKVFGKEESERFHEWGTASPCAHVILDGHEDYRKEMNTFDRFLGLYPPFPRLCCEVDDSTHLYPLQKAIIQGFQWDEGVRQIFEEDKEVLGFPFPDTELFPFQMAASVGSFELSFHILRLTPPIVLERVRTSVSYHLEEPQPIVFQQAEDGVYDYSSSDEDMDGENLPLSSSLNWP